MTSTLSTGSGILECHIEVGTDPQDAGERIATGHREDPLLGAIQILTTLIATQILTIIDKTPTRVTLEEIDVIRTENIGAHHRHLQVEWNQNSYMTLCCLGKQRFLLTTSGAELPTPYSPPREPPRLIKTAGVSLLGKAFVVPFLGGDWQLSYDPVLHKDDPLVQAGLEKRGKGIGSFNTSLSSQRHQRRRKNARHSH